MDKTQEKIVNKYIEFILSNKKRPGSIRRFMDDLKLKEGTFYKYFNSFDQLENDFWKSVF